MRSPVTCNYQQKESFHKDITSIIYLPTTYYEPIIFINVFLEIPNTNDNKCSYERYQCIPIIQKIRFRNKLVERNNVNLIDRYIFGRIVTNFDFLYY